MIYTQYKLVSYKCEFESSINMQTHATAHSSLVCSLNLPLNPNYFHLILALQSVNGPFLTADPSRRLRHDLLPTLTLGERNNISHTSRVPQRSTHAIPAKCKTCVRRTPGAQRLEQMAKVLNTSVAHLQDVAEDVLLHGRDVNSPAATAQFDAVDN